MSHLQKIFGNDRSHIAILIIAILVYAATLAINPSVFVSCINSGLLEIQKLLIPIIAAMFLGGLMKNLLSPKAVSRLFGNSGARNVFTAGLVGSVLPPCPFAAYPLISAFKDRGMAVSAFMTMLITSTMVEVPQIFAGIAILGLRMEITRILFAFLASMIVGYLFFFYTRKRNL